MASSLASACGGDPPDKEMQQAQSAIDRARVSGADEYARDEITAADEALKRSRDAVAQRDYRLALNNALDSRERAQTAEKDAAGKKAIARTDAERLVAAATAALSQSRASLKTAERARPRGRTLPNARRSIAAADLAVQKAGAAFRQDKYRDAEKALDGVIARLTAVTRDLNAAAGAAPRRRR